MSSCWSEGPFCFLGGFSAFFGLSVSFLSFSRLGFSLSFSSVLGPWWLLALFRTVLVEIASFAGQCCLLVARFLPRVSCAPVHRSTPFQVGPCLYMIRNNSLKFSQRAVVTLLRSIPMSFAYKKKRNDVKEGSPKKRGKIGSMKL